jgi:flavodoxin
VQLVCEKIAAVLKTHGYNCQLLRAERTDIAEVITGEVFILATSTWEHGRINPFYDVLLKEISKVDLQGKSAGFVGLGDVRYEPVYFCEGINLIQQTFTRQKGSQIGEVLKINGDPYQVIDTDVVEWAHMFANNLLDLQK